MSNKEGLHLIVFCRHPEILETLLRIIRQKTDHTADGCLCINDLNKFSSPAMFDMVLIGSGFTEDEESLIQSHTQLLKPGTPVVFHYGGGSGLLHAEISAAIATQQIESLW